MAQSPTLTELRDALAAGHVSAVELVGRLLDRIDDYAGLHAFSIIDPETVLAEARAADQQRLNGNSLGPLHGIPVAIKDNIAVASYPNAAGTPALAKPVMAADAPLVTRLREAGAIVLGKTTMHELAWGTTSINPFSGTPRNPTDPNRTAGGSSGGAGVAVAAGLAPVAIGTDTGGSVRIPAALCGVWGFRPTVGRWPGEAIVPISRTRDTAGPLARNAGDLALLHTIMTGETIETSASVAGKRIGIPDTYFWSVAQPETAAICRAALNRLQEAGAELVDVEIGNLAKHYDLASFDIALYETKRDLALYLEHYAPGVTLADVIGQIASVDVRETLEPLLEETAPISDERYQQALLVHRAALRQIYQDLFDRHKLTALAFPTVPMPALPLDQGLVDLPTIGLVPAFLAMIHNTGPGSTAGIPGISMPAGRTAEGMPVGLAFDGPDGGDKALLEFAIAAGAVMG